MSLSCTRFDSTTELLVYTRITTESVAGDGDFEAENRHVRHALSQRYAGPQIKRGWPQLGVQGGLYAYTPVHIFVCLCDDAILLIIMFMYNCMYICALKMFHVQTFTFMLCVYAGGLPKV